jgi:hypothetical protein
MRPRMREDAAEMNGSVPPPASAQARFTASVTASRACRARYSLTASLYSWLRDFLVRFARSSAPYKRLFGIESAVFIPLVTFGITLGREQGHRGLSSSASVARHRYNLK